MKATDLKEAYELQRLRYKLQSIADDILAGRLTRAVIRTGLTEINADDLPKGMFDQFVLSAKNGIEGRMRELGVEL